MPEIHMYDVGTRFAARIVDDATGEPIDVSAAGRKEIKFKKFNGDTMTKDAVFTTDGKDGWIEYVTSVTEDLNVKGVWNWQGYVEDGVFKNHSKIHDFEVMGNL